MTNSVSSSFFTLVQKKKETKGKINKRWLFQIENIFFIFLFCCTFFPFFSFISVKNKWTSKNATQSSSTVIVVPNKSEKKRKRRTKIHLCQHELRTKKFISNFSFLFYRSTNINMSHWRLFVCLFYYQLRTMLILCAAQLSNKIEK